MIVQKRKKSNPVISSTSMSLVTLPTEILNRILDHLDIHSILFSFRSVCKRFYEINNNYNRYELDVSSTNIKPIARLIQPNRIASLILRSDKTELFSRCFDSQEFHQLVSLTLIEIDPNKLDHTLQLFAACTRLISLSVSTSANSNKQITNIFSSDVTKFTLRKLVLKSLDLFIDKISWQRISIVEHLVLGRCTFSQYEIILNSLPYLKTLTMNDCIATNRDKMLSMSYNQLISLSITDCHLCINDIQFVISRTPSLVYLKLGSHRNKFDSTFNGLFWENFLKTNFPSFAKFQFLFSYTMSKDDAPIDIDSLIQSFETSFYSKNIQCDYNIQENTIHLYTTPILINLPRSSSPSIAIRLNINGSSTLTWIDGIRDVISTEVFSIYIFHCCFILLFLYLDTNRNKTSIESHR